MNAIRSALTWAAIVLVVLVALPVMAVVWVFDRDPARYATGRVFRYLGGLTTRLNPAWRVERSGRLPADPRAPFVVVANHQSNADIPLISTLPWEMKWVAKEALFRLPVFGWLLRMAGDIPVDRGDPASRARVSRRAADVLAHRCSVMFMPEGTRSRDGRVRRFQDGAFRLAIEAGVPVLPIAIDGTADALPKHGWQFGTVHCRLHVFDPVPTAGLSVADAPALRARVRAQVVEQIAAWRGVPPEAVDGEAAPALDAAPPVAGAPAAGALEAGAPEAAGRAPRGRA